MVGKWNRHQQSHHRAVFIQRRRCCLCGDMGGSPVGDAPWGKPVGYLQHMLAHQTNCKYCRLTESKKKTGKLQDEVGEYVSLW